MDLRVVAQRLGKAAGISFALLVLLSTVPSFALTYGRGTYGACTYNTCSITIGSTGSVAVNVVPTSGGTCTVQKDTVTVTTASSTGYTLSLASSTTSVNLVSGSNQITPTSGTLSSPALLTANKWGYRVDGAGGFGAGPTSAQSSGSIPGVTFAKLLSSTSAPGDTLASTSTAAESGAQTAVWYGVCANTTQPAGNYSAQVLYTAVIN